MKENTNSRFRIVIALILATAMLLLPMDTLALGNAQVATPDEAELSATGASLFSGDGSQESPYLIQSSDDWDALSNYINSGGTDYTGKYFMLTDDISVSTVLGNRPDSSSDSNDNVFCGTFDGDGHKLTVNLNGSDFGAAPFAFAYNTTIKNLRVDGTINSTAYHASGLVAASKGKSIYDESFLTIQNVTVSVDVSCTSHIAGLIGHAHAANITMENVVFDGSLNASNIQGGMIGWGGLGNGAKFNASFKDCLFAGTYNTNAAFYPIAYANEQGTTTLVNDFYTTSFGSGGSPIAPTGDGQLKLLVATVEKDGAVNYFDNINTAADSSNWTQGSTLKLMTDVTTSSTITVPSGEHTLDLNGHGIKMTGSGSVISVGSGATLNVEDGSPDVEHKFTVADAASNGAGLATVNDALTSGYKTFTGGYITGGYALTGGGININGGTLNMDGGSVIGNRADNNGNKGGGLCISNNGKVTLSGGSISYNYAQNAGGGVALRDGDFTMTGGEISHNRVSHAGGAGMAFHYTGTFTMTGGAIINNHAGWTGGGIDCYSANEGDARIIISGSPVITENLADNNGSSIDSVNNVMLRGNIRFTVDSELTDKAAIDVLLQNGPGEFTSGWKDKMGNADPAKYFTSTDSSYSVFLNNNGEAEIGTVPHEHNDLSFSKWTYTTSLPSTAGDYCLSADVTISSRWDVPAGTTNLCLNGHSITRTNASGATGMVINVGSGAVLNLYDCDDETTHYYTVDDPSPNGAGLGRVVDESTYQAAGENARGTFKGGYITGGSITGENDGTSHLVGGGVNVDSGSFTLNGGTIIGNSVTWNGGGVKVRGKNASFTMNGGAILANWNRYYGGGISVGDNNAGNVCKLKINGGTIRHNWSGRNGGAIHLDGKAHTVLINGGNIIDNYTDGNLESTGRSGGGILTDVTSVQLSGTPVIKGNVIKSGASNNVSVRANGSDRLDLSGHLEQGADVGIYVPGWTSNANADYMVATGAEQSDIRYVHYDVPSEGLLLFCDGSKDWICSDGALVELSGGHHTHQAGTVWVSSLPVAAVTAGETTTLYGSLDAAVSAWTTGSTLKLLDDVSIDTTITVPSGEHTLDLNGHGIKMTGSGSVINVGSGVTLDLTDSDQTKTHQFDVPDGAGLAALNETSGNYTVNGGYITGGNANQGGGVYVKGGTFTLSGGTIIGNQAQREGGGVFYESNSFSMNGGAIIYNKSQTHWGGGINVAGTFNMSGGVVSHNYAGDGAGGVHCHYLVMTGGSITDNHAASSYAGGVNVNNDATLSGNVTITGNTNNAGKSNLICKSVIIADALSDTSSIGIKTQSGTGTFTSGWKDKMGEADPSKYFTSDDSNYAVLLNNNGEAEIAPPPVASIISGDVTTNYSTISDAVNAWTEGSTLKLLEDVTTSSTITVPSGEHTLDLNGCGILMTGNDRVITINQGASLELNDSRPDTVHYITLSDYRGTAVSDSGEESVSNGNGVIKVTGGYLTGGYRNNSGSHDRCGAGVYNWGTFVMNGGSIVGNTLFNNSGGGIRNSGYFTMNGGTIAFNYASGNGGGVTTYVPGGSQGKMTMNGGEISDNYCGSYGGGIQIAGPIEMTGGFVVRNTAAAGGSGVFYDGKNDRFKLSGNPVIKDNSNKDDLYLGANATFMINGSLTEEADIHVLMNTPAEFTVGWKNIMGNADPSKYFTSDDSNYAVILNNNGEAEIAPPPVASVISGDTTTNYSTISDAVSAWTADSTLKLLADVTTNSTITVPSGAHTLDLNGYNLEAGSTGYSVVTVGSGAELTIDDTSENVGKITGGSVGQNYGGGVTVDGGTLMLKGGAISGNANTHGGIGNCGGGVHVRNSGKFYMEGGEISGNTSYVGGGVCSDASATTVSITGGVIKNNKTERFGSAVWAGRSSSSIFRIGGDVQIIDNISTWTADKDGEASLNFVGELLLSGNPTVHGDWKTSGTSSPNTHINLDNDGSGVQRLTLEGALTNDTGVPSITMSPIYRWNDLRNGQTFVFTKNWSQYMGTAHPADYFKLDSGVSGVTVIRKDGEAAFTGSGDLGDLYITFDANGGEGEMDPQLTTVTNVTLNENTFTRKGYSFAGWNTEKDGSGTAYADKASISLSGDLVLYAQWAEPAVSIISGDVTIGYGSLSDAVSAWTAGSTLKLLEDVTTTSTITVPAGAHTLDLNGFTITRTGATGTDNSGLVMTVNNGVDLTVTGPGKITGGSGFHGGGIHVEGNSSLVLDNCEISGNTGHYGGGLYLSVGTITLKNGAAVKNNTATEGFGGSGIYAEGGGTLILEDATFTENAIRNGNQHAVFLAGNANIKVSGAPVIYDNTYNGEQKNLYLYQAADQHSYVMPAGALTDGAKIGVGQTTGAGVFTVGWPTYMSDPDSAAYFISGVANYDVLMNQDGELEIAYPLVPDVSAEGFAGDYDGAAHSITVTAPEGASVKYGLQEGSFTLTENPTFTDAGTYTVYYEVSKPNYTAVTGSAEVVIRQINANVTITGYSATVDYDGAAHRSTGYQTAFSTSLYTEHDILFNGTAYAELTDVGTAMMGLKADQFTNTNDNFANVTFNVTDGYITVRPIDVTVTITGRTDIVAYDGAAHSVSGYDAAASSSLYDVTEDFTFSGTARAEQTDAGIAMMGLKSNQFTNTNSNFAQVTFNVTDGSMTVNPIDVIVTITGHTDTLDYDGKAHSVSGYDASASSSLYDVTEDFTFNGTAQAELTNAGTAYMGLSSDQFKNINPNFDTVAFYITDGYVTVNPIDVTVTVTGYHNTVDYDGEAHRSTGYKAAFSSPLYQDYDILFNGTAYAELTDAGTAMMGLRPDQFTNMNSNFARVTFNVTDGYITVNPIDVTVTITGHTATLVYDGKAHSVSGYDAAASSSLYDVTGDFTFSGAAQAEQTDVGSAYMGLRANQFSNINPNFADVTFTVTDGYQTITRADAVMTTAPYAKDKLVYTGSEQQLIMPGSVTGGTLYYALGTNGSSAPAASSYSTRIPTASQIGNYYIWYKVIADANHNNIDPASVKITLAEPDWMTIKGKITFGDGSAASDDVTVTLMSGNTVVDTIVTDANGGYYFTVPAGVYNIVVKSGDVTQTVMVDITQGSVRDITLSDANTKSVLDVVSSDKHIVVGGLDEEAASVRSSEGLASNRSVTVKMTVATVSAGDTSGSSAFSDYEEERYLEYYDMKVEKTVDSVTTALSETRNILEVAIPFAYTSKRDLAVYRYDGSGVQELAQSSTGDADTYRVDSEAGLVYIYANRFQTYAISYKPYYRVQSQLTLGGFSGSVSVKLTKNTTGETYELNNVSMQDISFTGVPKGVYTMTVTWKDGVENTLTMPFVIQ